MKAFESTIGPLMESYIAYRSGLGYSGKHLRSILSGFDRYVSTQKANLEDLNPLFFLELKKTLRSNQNRFNTLLRAARGFFAYLARRAIVLENPLADIESYASKGFIPFVFSPNQTGQLLAAAQNSIRKHDPDCFFTDYTACMVIMLLARYGMRIKEPVRLALEDYQSDRKTVYIKKTKFGKDRLIPIPAATAARIDTYLHVRKAFVTNDNPYLFAGKNGKSLPGKHIYGIFIKACKPSALNGKKWSLPT